MKSFYNYIILDPRKPGQYAYEGLNFSLLYEPFYIGKGRLSRKYAHLYPSYLNKRSLKSSKLKTILSVGFTKKDIKTYIIETAFNLSEEESFKNEIQYIKYIGRVKLRTGPLCNHTNGGEGTSGTICSEEHKNKIREKRKLQVMQPRSEETKNKIRDKRKYQIMQPRSEEVRNKIRNSVKEGHKNNPRCWITKDTENKQIYKQELDIWASYGWKRGRTGVNKGKTYSIEARQRMSEAAKLRKYK
jgi:hypothetical protein